MNTKKDVLDIVNKNLQNHGIVIAKHTVEMVLDLYAELIIDSVKKNINTWSPIGIFKPRKLSERSGIAKGVQYTSPARTTVKLDVSSKYESL